MPALATDMSGERLAPQCDRVTAFGNASGEAATPATAASVAGTSGIRCRADRGDFLSPRTRDGVYAESMVVLLLILCGADIDAKAGRLRDAAADALTPVAEAYETSGREEDAARVRTSIDPPDVRALPLRWPAERVLPEPGEVPPADRPVYEAELAARRELATRVYRLAREAVREKRVAEAFRLTHWAAALDPDNESVRRALGFERDGKVWTTPFRRQRAADGDVWDDRFGWLPKSHVARYEAGERFAGGQWVTPESERQLRSRFDSGWAVETEHFRVRTNASLETAVTLASELEDFRTFFVRNYTVLFDSPRRAASILVSPTGRRSKRHDVHVFATREEYVQTLAPKQRGVEVSRGVYLPEDRVAYFFASEDAELLETLYHEVSHQLLYEADRRGTDVGGRRGYWAVEGFACYLESFESDGVTATATHPRQNRVQHAAELVAEGKAPRSLAEFDALGKRAFLNTPDMDLLVARYAYATGLTHFFLNFEGGRYRDGFLTYLRTLYEPGARVRPLEQVLGVPAGQVDMEYRSYIGEL